MRTRAIAILIWGLALGRADMATANCTVINALDKLYTVETRLANDINTPSFSSDIRFLRDQMALLDIGVVLDSIGNDHPSVKGTTFLRFMRNTSRLILLAQASNQDRVHQHLNDHAVRTNLYSIGNYLTHLRCPTYYAPARASAPPRNQNSTTEILRKGMSELLDLTNFGILSGIATTAFGGFKLFKAWAEGRKRRAKRHTCNFSTTYRIKRQHSAGVLIDISGNGTKLRHDPNAPVTVGTQIDIQMFDGWQSGRVTWNNAHYCGVLFNRALGRRVVRKIHKHPPSAPRAAA